MIVKKEKNQCELISHIIYKNTSGKNEDKCSFLPERDI